MNFEAGWGFFARPTRELERINRMNILICTPGRLLQHMDQTVNFKCDNLQVLADAPENAETYIHRVGRIARYEASGQDLLFVDN
ncbi:4068_t:CDS:2 [Funneliformis mosseae]|uniref:ATP-dependent RNA helicase n=1 Tax=Funneliformis mosseae TaxID=27381 RepID=A0A9N9CWK9_FUNMO|nr:4068_t:CDS:2 [Funneliformis mosseae]